MPDVLSPEQRHRNMSAIRGTNTKPELVVRKLVREFGCRYRLNKVDLPGKPDIVLSRHSKVIFVHGCFWHMHCCRYGRVRPATNAVFWSEKRESNVKRDRRVVRALRRAGWRVLIVWECQTKQPKLVNLENRLRRFLAEGSA